MCARTPPCLPDGWVRRKMRCAWALPMRNVRRHDRLETMTTTTYPAPGARTSTRSVGGPADLESDRTVDWRRLRRRGSGIALTAMAIAAILQSLGTVVIGRLAADPMWITVAALAGCLLGYALLDTAGRTVWAVIADRAEGRLRRDLLSAALNQPLELLSEQAVGEVLDRVDDDTHEVGTLVRMQLWDALRTVFSVLPMWVVAGLTWWPAWIIFPVVGPLTVWVIRPLLRELSKRKVSEEIAWTDHAAAMEEGIAARDDMRTSLGQALRPSAVCRALWHRATTLPCRGRRGVAHHPSRRGTAARVSRRGGDRGRRLGHRRRPRRRPPDHAVPRQRHPGRRDRPAGPSAARTAGGDGRGHPPAPARRQRIGTRWRTAISGRPGRHRARRPALRLHRGCVRPRRARSARGGGHHVRARRPDRLGQVDARVAGVARRRSRTRLAVPRRRRRARPRSATVARIGRGGHAAHRDPRRHSRREHRAVRRPTAQAGAGRRRRARPDRLGRQPA